MPVALAAPLASVPLEVWLPPFNTALIVVSGAFLLLGYYFIRRRKIASHRAAMLTATVFAGLFVAVYVARYFLLQPKVFAGEGPVRVIYLAILISHTVLAVAVAPLALVTLRRALRAQYRRHRQIARVTLPIWLYVVVTGWTVYLMLNNVA
jgi:putative membrane protein